MVMLFKINNNEQNAHRFIHLGNEACQNQHYSKGRYYLKWAVELLCNRCGTRDRILISKLFNKLGELDNNCYKSTQSNKIAKQYFRKAIKFNPKNGLAYFNLALLEMNASGAKACIHNAKQAIALNANPSKAYVVMGIADMYLKKIKLATLNFKKSLKLKKCENVYYFTGKEEADMDDYSQSEYFFKKAIEFNPKNGDNYKHLADLYADDMHLPHLAIKCYQKAISLNRHNSSYYHALAKAEVAIGKVPKAIPVMEHAIAQKANSDSLYDDLGRLYYRQGGKTNLKMALKCFKEAAALNNENETYYYHAGIINLNLRDYDASLQDMHNAEKAAADPNYANKILNMYNNKGLKYGNANKNLLAKPCFKLALQFGDSNTIHYNLARADEALNDKHRAIKEAEKGLNRNFDSSGYKYCKRLIKRLKPKTKNSIHELDYNSNVDYSKRLADLIGLKAVKRQVKRYVDRAVIHKLRTGKPGHGEIHLVLEGNPGTGKTTVAKLLCGILYQKHVINKKIFIPVNATQLLGWRYGESAKNTRKLIKKARGGVLFIDEAYHLRHRTDGNSACEDEIIAELLPDIEKYRDDLVVIMAGYTRNMEDFLKRSNPGLGSRFPDRIQFPDYTTSECDQIMQFELNKDHFRLASKATKHLLNQDLSSYIGADRSNTDHAFANARTVRNVLKELKESFAGRLMAKYTLKQLKTYKKQGRKLLNTITVKDVRHTFKKYNLNRNSKDAIQRLNSMVGLKNVKHLIKSSVNQVMIHKIRTGNSDHDEMNMVFEGNPGTGKTTVAKLFCRILYQKGITKSPKYVYVSATHLSSKWTGQSAKNVRKAFYQAKNGVLFIDEAYALNNPGNKSIVDQLVSEISKYRNKIVVILAGYQKSMERFLNGANAGLSSRFPDRIKFHNYNNNECLEILERDLKHRSLVINSAKAKRVLARDFKAYISTMRQRSGKHFANARTVNNYFKYLCRSFDNRMSHNSIKRLKAWKQSNNKRLSTIDLSDVERTNRKMTHLAKLAHDSSDYNGTAIGFKSDDKPIRSGYSQGM